MSSISGFGGATSASMTSQMRERMFANLDANGDNSIDKSEFGKAQESAGMGRGGMPSADKMFAKVDGNGDGKLTKDELKSFEERVSSEMKSVLIGAQSDASGAGSQNLEELFSALDEDGDGSVTKREFEAFGWRNGADGDRGDMGGISAMRGANAYEKTQNQYQLPTTLADLLGTNGGDDDAKRSADLQSELIGMLMKV